MGKIKNNKTENIILRVDKRHHSLIKLRSEFFSTKKSEYIRNAVLSHWEDDKKNTNFKRCRDLYLESDEENKQHIVDMLFEYYRRTGFPYHILNDKEKIAAMNRLMNTKDVLLDNNHLQMNVTSVELANCFHHHMMEARYNDKSLTPLETYLSDISLKDCIQRWLELGNVPNPSGIRRILKTRDGTRSVVNFKPSISKYIYETYVPEGGVVLDPCSGYSGRLVGCISANKGIKYHGIDPDGRTACGNTECASFFSKFYDILGNREYNFGFSFDLGCAEDIMPELDRKYDLIFTSPPYFNTEIYSPEGNQSCHRHKAYRAWLDGFLFKVVDESYRILKDDGRLILNVKNISDKYCIADDLLRYCDVQWELERTYYMRLANSEYHRNGDGTYHSEPIFVFSRK